MNPLNKISIRAKLLVLTLILLLPLVYFIGKNIEQKIVEQKQLQKIEQEVIHLEHLRLIINALQNERGLSQSFVSSNGKLFQSKLLSARKEASEEKNRFERFLQQNGITSAGIIMLESHIYKHRESIESLVVDSSRVDFLYTRIIKQFIDEIEEVANEIPDIQLKNDVKTFIALLHAKEYLGQLRSLTMKIVSTRNFSYNEYGEFSLNKASFDLFLNEFYSSANDDQINYFNSETNSKNLEQLLFTINAFYSSHSINAFKYSPQNWFDIITTTIYDLANTANYSITSIKEKVVKNKASAASGVVIYITILAALLLFTILLSFYIIRMITIGINGIKVAAERISNGDVEVEIKVATQDEIGALAISFQSLIENINQYVVSAEKIGTGNYDAPLQVRGENDKLGNALLKMKSNLRQLSIVERRKSWFLSADKKLNDVLRGEKDLYRLSERLITFLCRFLQIEVGAVYLEEAGKLKTSGFYGAGVDMGKYEFSTESGYLGQAIREKDILFLTDLNEDYLEVKTGLGKVRATNVMLLPVYFEANFLCIIELASTKPFKKNVVEFLTASSLKIGVVMMNIKSELKTQHLLFETQQQAEELQAQQEELRQINDELVIQRNRLQASEEEIRASQEELQEKNFELEEKANQLEEQYEAIHLKNEEIENARLALQANMMELEQTSKYKSEFLANMSHELRTPLNSVLILAKILADNKDKNLTEKQVEFAEIIHNSGNDLLRLINDILDLAKIESGKISLEMTEFNFDSINIYEEFIHLAHDKKIDFSVHKDIGLPAIITDKFRLMQIVKNLLSNAFKFTPSEGKISVAIRKAETGNFRNPVLKNAGQVIAISVSDSGIGISKEKQDLIFEAFHQEDASITRKFGGTGLGLSISRELSKLLGGEIQVESELGKGSTFTLYIPDKLSNVEVSVAPPKLKPLKKKGKPAEVLKTAKPESGDKKILIVEDDKNFAAILEDVARSKNYIPVTANRGEDALKLIDTESFNALVLDINLPDMKGWKVFERLNEKGMGGIPVHIISAEEQYDIPSDLPDFKFSLKPLDKDSLENVFDELFIKNLKGNVLIIEDNVRQNDAIKELLLTREIISDQVFRADEAIEKIKAKGYECIILDLDLPDINGYELIEKLRNSDLAPELPIVIYSGKDLSRKEEEKLKRYANTIIIKSPYSYDRLLAEVNLFMHSIKEKEPEVVPVEKLHIADKLLNGKKVLIVDDDIRNIYALHSVLEQEGMEIITAGNGYEALAEIDKNKDVDIVLMDIMMPEMDGIEAIKRIRKQDGLTGLPIIAVTAKAMKGDREATIEAGASDYISKPVDINKLLSLMRVWLY